jgi:hypothetical protein
MYGIGTTWKLDYQQELGTSNDYSGRPFIWPGDKYFPRGTTDEFSQWERAVAEAILSICAGNDTMVFAACAITPQPRGS